MTVDATGKPKILIYDIETAPDLIYAFGTREVNALKIVRESYILCFAYKWFGEKTTRVVALPDFKSYYRKNPHCDAKVIRKLHALFSEADIVIAHNGDKFDQRRSQARFLMHGLGPPSPYRSIDTLKIARKYFALPSNRLDALGEALGVGRKSKHEGLETWFGCMDGDEKSWRIMKRYNRQDVKLLEEVYLKLRPWFAQHPNLTVFSGAAACPKCGSGRMESKGWRRTQVYSYRRLRCLGCGGWHHEKHGLNTAGPMR